MSSLGNSILVLKWLLDSSCRFLNSGIRFLWVFQRYPHFTNPTLQRLFRKGRSVFLPETSCRAWPFIVSKSSRHGAQARRLEGILQEVFAPRWVMAGGNIFWISKDSSTEIQHDTTAGIPTNFGYLVIFLVVLHCPPVGMKRPGHLAGPGPGTDETYLVLC